MILLRLLVMAAMLGWNVQQGYAPHYSEGLMQRVARNRGMARVGCMISSPTLPLGTFVYVYGVNTGELRYCEIVDVSAPRDKARHLRTRRVVELDYAVTKSLCGTINGSSAECPVVVIGGT